MSGAVLPVAVDEKRKEIPKDKEGGIQGGDNDVEAALLPMSIMWELCHF
jgi:hypothetical protein